MTIVLGRRPATPKTNKEQAREAWIERFSRKPDEAPVEPPRVTLSMPQPRRGMPAPVPLAEIRTLAHRPANQPSRRTWHAPEDGIVGFYSSRLDACNAQRLTEVPAHPSTAVRTIGRSSGEHFTSLHPHKGLEVPLDEARSYVESTVSIWRQRISGVRTHMRIDFSFVSTWFEHTFGGLSLGHSNRLAFSTKPLMAALAALVLLTGMAASTFATEQYRYEVQPGDTLTSIAAEFNVDPEAIYRSSWMPNGYQVEAGQVVIIPIPGQTPSDAAIMAAEREGTSPWAIGVHYIQHGDTFNSIAAAWGVPVQVLVNFNPEFEPTDLRTGDRIVIPAYTDGNTVAAQPANTVATSNAPASQQASSNPQPALVQLLPVQNYTQAHNLTCEYAATYAATTAFGAGVSEQMFIDAIPVRPNPHLGYRGNMDGTWGGTDDYGIYAEPLVPVLAAHGYTGDVFYTNGDTQPLIDHLDAGHPVVVWMGFYGDNRVRLADDGEYSVFAGMHVMTAVGYDELGVYVMDPARGTTRHLNWDEFVDLWSVVDGMSLAVYPQP